MQKNKYTYSVDGKQLNFNSIKNLFIIASNPKTTKDEVKSFLKNTIGTEMQEINKTNARGQNKEKNFMLGVYETISTLFRPLSKPDDEQPDAADMYDLESNKYTDQEGKGLKILTPNQIPGRLQISLAQLKVGNNSEKLQATIVFFVQIKKINQNNL